MSPPADHGRREASPPVAHVPPTGEPDLRQLRLLSAEVRDLRVVLTNVRDGELPLAYYADYIRITVAQMEEIIAPLQGDDCVRHIHNAWEQMRSCRILAEPQGSFDAQEQLKLLTMLDSLCRQITYWTAHLTVPDRLKAWLAGSEPGYAIPFHAVFDDELPDPDDRQKILNHLAWSPTFLKAVGAVVDPQSGLVYRYAHAQNRYLPLLPLLGAVAVGTAVVVALAWWGGSPIQALVIGWAALLVGTLAHVGVGVAKRLKSQDPLAAVLPLSRFLIMVSARQGYIVFQIVMALVGYMGLVYTVGGYANLETFAVSAFLAGYSLDSVIEIFGTTLDDRAAAQTARLKQKVATR